MARSGSVSGVESSAIGLLLRAVEMDGAKRFTEALVCYQEGLNLLLEVVKGTTEERKKQHLRTRMVEYMDRAEKLKLFIEKEKESGNYHEQLRIENDSAGNSFEKVFGRFVNEDLTYVEIEDPYVRNVHQIHNFLRVCELLIKLKSKVRKIKLLTGEDEGAKQQKDRFEEIRRSLHKYNIELVVSYSSTLHDREIRFNNGWIIKIGRGLDYFKLGDGKFAVGYLDMDLRPCHETTVDIFHQKNLKQLGATGT
ncbi:MIT domain-containing protein 1-like [Lineus longissimus]|uniref:MIT domain-containing protein 1-like n=1 Tax=Lineus longissimus TaxID=88925 RepID=UPI002B4DDCF5